MNRAKPPQDRRRPPGLRSLRRSRPSAKCSGASMTAALIPRGRNAQGPPIIGAKPPLRTADVSSASQWSATEKARSSLPPPSRHFAALPTSPIGNLKSKISIYSFPPPVFVPPLHLRWRFHETESATTGSAKFISPRNEPRAKSHNRPPLAPCVPSSPLTNLQSPFPQLTTMETFAPGDRVVAINTDMSAPIYPPPDSERHPFQFPDGPLRRNVVYHVEAVFRLSCGRQGALLTGIRVTWGNQVVPWHSSRFRKVQSLRDHAPKKRRKNNPSFPQHLSSSTQRVGQTNRVG